MSGEVEAVEHSVFEVPDNTFSWNSADNGPVFEKTDFF